MAEAIQVPPVEDTEAALAAVVALRRLANQLESAAVAHAIGAGWTWAEVGQALGISPQAAHKKLAPLLPEPSPRSRTRSRTRSRKEKQ
ncbi:helix-turn-helix domain-containing protein [Motilibacter aurantiacus]|uniref:helix-turn-helix domain-containing protein n=1 Tax=Motilibacter aurantiacus TaxID=2714955 RepID=UPI00140C7657|nr:helix-turn-helix domain-containing protein [Motilibacter aurantiacus]NHC44509.1 helix-turn-helix domain-containing protein [Motilibacter aurantiacus]